MKHGKKEEHDPELTFKPNLERSKASKPKSPVKKKSRRAYQSGSSVLKAASVADSKKQVDEESDESEQ